MLTGKELAKVVNGPGVKTQSMLAAARPYLIGALPMAPVVAEEAQGAVIKDVEGDLYVDMFAGVGVLSLGHRYPTVVEAVKNQMDKIMCTMVNYCQYAPDLELAQKLNTVTPGGQEMRVVFSSSGSEAVENAVKIAKAATGRHGVIALTNAFHGRTLLTGALTHKCAPQKNGFGPQPSEIYRLSDYYPYRYDHGMSEDDYIQYLIDEAEFAFANTIDSEDVACFIAECVQGEGGFIPQPAKYLKAIKDLCEKYGILYIADEIQSGFCRTGKFFAIEHMGFNPDIMTIAKSMADGMPLAATLVKSELDKVRPGQLGGTYMGNAVACAASCAAVDAFKSFDFCGRAVEIGNYIKSRVEKMMSKHAQIGDFRGLGAMCAMEIVEDPKTKKPGAKLLAQIIKECNKRGMLVLSCGMRGNNMRFLPPLVITDEQLAQAMDILEEACDVVLD